MSDDNTYTIPVDALADFYAKIKKMNKKAAKLGCAAVQVDEVGTTTLVERSHTYRTADGEITRTYKVPAKTFRVIGSAPKLEGFQFVARVERTKLDGGSHMTLFHQVPGAGVKIDERFRAMDASTCEHCKMKRQRNDTFVVLELATGKQTQVGRQCLADFTGINSPQQMAAQAGALSLYSDLRDECERFFGKHFEETVDTLRVLQLTSAYIERYGWVPRSACKEGDRSTASLVMDHFGYTSQSQGVEMSMKSVAAAADAPQHAERAEAVLRWLRAELPARARGDYELNLVEIAKHDHVHRKHFGLLCSAVSAWQRAMNKAVEYKQRQASLQQSQHVGQEGERLRGLEVTVFSVQALESGDWGPSTLVKFLDASGNLLTWFASGDREYHRGAKAKLTGTVKRHTEYQGVKQTQLSRCAVDFIEEVAGA